MEEHELVKKSISGSTRQEFMDRVGDQLGFIEDELFNGSLDNLNVTIGLEMEVYAVDDENRLASLPDDVFIGGVLNKELGLHNAELNTKPSVLSSDGFDSQRDEILEKLDEARDRLDEEDLSVVLDAMWTIPPNQGSVSYLSDVVEDDGVSRAVNMRGHPRYLAIDNSYIERRGEVRLDVPGATHSFPTILVESLATSIQPHIQVPNTGDLPGYFNTSIRTMPALLALSTNSPFLPYDLYNEVDDELDFLNETHHELRIAVFEQSVNLGVDRPNMKVRVPRDIDEAMDVVRRVKDDVMYAGFLREWVDGEEGYRDNFWELDFKRGTYWRWVRTVIGGEPLSEENDERSMRIEYRPLPTQPTVKDVISLQAVTSGLIIGLTESDHPVTEIDWSESRDDFYDVARNGLNAGFTWINSDGERLTEKDAIYDDVFRYAEKGLREKGVSDSYIEEILEPVRWRARNEFTPSMWKIQKVRDGLRDGLELDKAIHEMQTEYIELSDNTDSFKEWM